MYVRLMLLSIVAQCTLIMYQPTETRGDLITAFNVPVTEDFDTLASTGTSSILPKDWKLFETGTGANSTYAANNGASATANTYSYGATGSTERALGSLASGTVQSMFGSSYTNKTGATIPLLSIDFFGEHWRAGNTSSQKLDFQYSLDASDLTTGTWTDVDALDILSVNNTAVGAIDGNLASNQMQYSADVGSLSIAPDAMFWIRFVDSNDTGSDHGLAVDDFSITAKATVTPEPSAFTLTAIGVAALISFGRRVRRSSVRV